MKTTIVAIGVVLLIIGIGISAYGFNSPSSTTSTTTSTSTVPVVRDTSRTVLALGFWALGAQNLSPGEVVTGTVSMSNYSAAQGPSFFYIQNESTFIAWGACAPCDVSNAVNQTIPSSGSYTFTWTVPTSGSYYFVLDNSAYNASAPATFVASTSASTSVPVTVTSSNTTLEYAGVSIVIIGAIVLAAGIVVGASRTKQD